jgi:AraC family transcriptional regulator
MLSRPHGMRDRPVLLADKRARGGLAQRNKLKLDRYLREHYDEPLSLEDLAVAVSLSVSHFCRAFKESFGISPHARIIELRLEAAQQLMLTTEDRLSHIAVACGLADQAHLSKLFVREFGESPAHWRKQRLKTIST